MNRLRFFLIMRRLQVLTMMGLAALWVLAGLFVLFWLQYCGGKGSIFTDGARLLTGMLLFCTSALVGTVVYWLLRRGHPTALIRSMVAEVLLLILCVPLIFKDSLGIEYLGMSIIPLTFLFAVDTKASRRYCLVSCCVMGAAMLYLLLMQFLSSGRPLPFVLPYCQNARVFFACVSAAMLVYASSTMAFLLARSNARLQRRTATIAYEADHDTLTGLMNRRRTYEILNRLQDKKDMQGADFAIAIFDIDNFKRFNEDYGHDCGDFALKEFANRVRYGLPEELTKVGRWGGEEFIVIYLYYNPKIPFELDELRRRITAKPLLYQGQRIDVTATFGISSSREISTYEDVIVDADQNLLDGKQHGKNRIKVSGVF